MDVTNFMTWFLNQIVSMFQQIFSTLENFQFLGTNLLQVTLTIMILGALIPIIFTIAPSGTLAKGYKVGVSERIKEKKKGN